MDKILKRDEFVQLMEQKEYEDLKVVNEGLLKNLFGMVKNMFKKDWEVIDNHGNPELVRLYKEMDDKLTGFSIMKLSKKDECNKIRQELVDFACDWYDLKMNNAKESKSDLKPAKSMKFKNDTLRENLENTEKKIKEIAGDDIQMQQWANILLRDMKTVINRSILSEFDEDTKKEIEKDAEVQEKKNKETNKKVMEWENDQLKQLEKERETLITNVHATPEKGDDKGNKEVGKLFGSLNFESKDKFIESAVNDKLLGLGEIFKTRNGSKGVNVSDRSYNILNAFYTQLNKDTDQFKETPAQSVQAMCIAMNAFTKTCGVKEPKFDDLKVELMARCAIVSNGAISYKLPSNGKKGKEEGNYFTEAIGRLKNKSDEYKDIKLNDDFLKNADNLFKEIIKKKDELVEEFKKNREESLEKLNLGKE